MESIRMLRNVLILGVLIVATAAAQQTKVDLQNQARGIDFSSAQYTKPAKTGGSLPSTCSTGEAFVLTSATPGSNFYICTATDTWTLQAGVPGGDLTGTLSSAKVAAIQNRAVAATAPADGQTLTWNALASRWEPKTPASGPGGSGTATLNVLATSANGNVLTIGDGCSSSSPCNVRLGGTVYSIVSQATATLSSGTGMAFVYVAPGGVVKVGHNLTLTCAGCTAESGVTNFPPDVVPVAMWTASNGAWAVQTDSRAFLSKDRANTGTGLTTTIGADYQTISVDASVVGLRTPAPASAGSSCTSGAWAADTSYYYICVATNTWRRIAISAW
jgi:hypothetical protein